MMMLDALGIFVRDILHSKNSSQRQLKGMPSCTIMEATMSDMSAKERKTRTVNTP
jgi:propanediol dehydratase small subunit